MIKSLAKAGAAATFKFIVFFTLSQIFAVAFFIVGVILLLSVEGVSGGYQGAHTGGMFSLVMTGFYFFSIDFWPTLLVATTVFIFTPLYIHLSRKLSFETALNRMWKYNLQGPITEKLNNYIDKNQGIAQLDAFIASKKQLMQSIASDNKAPKIQKKMLSYIIKKVDFTGDDSSSGQQTLKGHVTEKINDYLSGFAEVNNWPFYGLIVAHVVLLVLAVVLDK